MEEILRDIIEAVREQGVLTPPQVNKILAAHNAAAYAHQRATGSRVSPDGRTFSKRELAPFYLTQKQRRSDVWNAWHITEDLHRDIIASIQMKPRRSASGVATITVITKPYICKGACVFCPNDVRMPKSYMHNEPACQRAERNFFDPLLQVASRIKALHEMGLATSKIELIVLGGTFADYPNDYQMWFIRELFFALNHFDDDNFSSQVTARRALYEKHGISAHDDVLAKHAQSYQDQVRKGEVSYNQAIQELFGSYSAWNTLAKEQTCTMEDIRQEHHTNEDATHRVVGLVVETRPNTITVESLLLLRALGCTKLQVGVQTLNEKISHLSKRPTPVADIRQAFELIRIFGFKSHAHFMVNLPGATPDGDKLDYEQFVQDASIAPDETKLYPCVLLADTELEHMHKTGGWQPYREDVLVDILAHDVLITPQHMRISRMIRDFSAPDILAGTKKTNLRQMVEQEVQRRLENGGKISEIRMREIATDRISAEDLHLDIHTYATANSIEYFLQWIDSSNHIAGFLRLSLPHVAYVRSLKKTHPNIPIAEHEAMIREVHIYGSAASLNTSSLGVQHLGLGKTLIEKALEIANKHNYSCVHVISAIGTRNYYRKLGFKDDGLYQTYAL